LFCQVEAPLRSSKKKGRRRRTGEDEDYLVQKVIKVKLLTLQG